MTQKDKDVLELVKAALPERIAFEHNRLATEIVGLSPLEVEAITAVSHSVISLLEQQQGLVDIALAGGKTALGYLKGAYAYP